MSQLLDDDLAESRRAHVAQHVNQCPRCQSLLDQLTNESLGPVAPGPLQGGEQDSTVTALVKRLIEVPPVFDVRESADGDEIQFPGSPTRDAPLGQLGAYWIQERIAAGANGILYRAHDSTLGRTVSVKVLRGLAAKSPTARARLLREGRAAAAIKSENVVTLFQVGDQPNFPPFLVLEFVDGQSLRDRLDAQGSLPAREAARITREAARGLAAAHEQGVVHRDVKPSNIMLERLSGRTKLTDFGLARSELDTQRLTIEGTIAGTPAYMSVEQITQPETVDARSDVYGLGVVLYELLTGEVPFRGVLRMTIVQILHDEPVPPSRLNDRIPRDLETICLKAMAKQREDRYESAQALGEDLDRWLADRPILARPASRVARVIRWSRRNPVIFSLAAAVASLLVLLTTVSTGAAWRLAAVSALARRHADEASQQRDAALATLGKLVFEIQDQFDEDVVDLDTLQENVLAVALDGLQTVDESAASRGVSGLQLATAHRRLGEILARTDGADAATRHLRQSIQMLEKLRRSQPHDMQVLRQLVETQWTLADVFIESDPDRAVRHAREAANWSETQRQQTKNDREVRKQFAQAFLILGQCQLADNRPRDAQTSLRKSRETYESLVAEIEDDPELIWKLWDTGLGLARAFQADSQPDTARIHWRWLLAAAESRHREHPELARPIGYLFAAYDGLEQVYRDLGQETLADEQRAAGLTLEKEIASVATPGPMYLYEIVEAFESLGTDLERIGELPAAERNARRQAAFLRQWRKHAPRDADAQFHHASALLQIISFERDAKRLAEAAGLAKQALVIVKPLAERADRDVEDFTLYVECLLEAAEVEQAQGNSDRAEQYLLEAESLLRDLSPADRKQILRPWWRDQEHRINTLKSTSLSSLNANPEAPARPLER